MDNFLAKVGDGIEWVVDNVIETAVTHPWFCVSLILITVTGCYLFSVIGSCQ